ncbi:hypothetical protein ATY41_12255 [Leifsonia xyli subsp. xyli]|uniref:SGNH hydrolase-type esterase domain-containing protein n=1 Tax=Leifsonia xyli subsp. xyli TaxID=59736 RepID=A0A1E2SIN9_LEIXY|nr:hypothetical protein [Leifsonia xyli]ODA89726.1 hypothetical protein ATY41_12255 [Leifsonia xyli subsp. xyli]
MPRAKKFAFTYPDVLPDPSNTPKKGNSVDVPFTDADVPYLHRVEDELNALIREESAKYGFTVVDVSARSEARTACSVARHWVNSFDALNSLDQDGDAFHPTSLGIAHYVNQVRDGKIISSLEGAEPGSRPVHRRDQRACLDGE